MVVWILLLIFWYWNYQSNKIVEDVADIVEEDIEKISESYSQEYIIPQEAEKYLGTWYVISAWESYFWRSMSIDIDYPELIASYNDDVKSELMSLFSWAVEIVVSIENIDNWNMDFLEDIISVTKDVRHYDFYFKFSEYKDEYYSFLKPLYDVVSIVSFDISFWKLNDTTLTKTIWEYVDLNIYHASRNKYINYLVFGSNHDDFWDYKVSISDVEKLYKLYSISFWTSLPWWDDVSYESRLNFLKNTPIQEYWDKRFHKWWDTIRERDSDTVYELWENHVEQYWPTIE